FELFEGNSFDATLSPEINFVVSELFGNDPFQEGVLPTLKNIAKHLNQNENVKYFPKKLSVYFEFIQLNEHHAKHRIHWEKAAHLGEQNESYKNFYNHFVGKAYDILDLKSASFALNLTARNFKKVSNTVCLGTLPLDPPKHYGRREHPLKGKKELSLDVQAENICGLIWFRVVIDEGSTISSHPQESDACDHWSPLILPMVNIQIPFAEKIDISYSLNEEENQFHCSLYSKDKLIAKR
ncbi:MAG: hypothetical protein K2X39_06785, partial [Silvanigrellaceae bacterium]|nr:hypothetical protein [Silvanigrellaceae bacterium]